MVVPLKSNKNQAATMRKSFSKALGKEYQTQNL